MFDMKYLVISIAIFTLSILAGHYFAIEEKDLANKILDQFFSQFNLEVSTLELFLFIFINNALKAFIAIITGLFFGIFPILFLYINGFLIGMLITLKLSEIGFYKILALILPHGIIEIPAVILSASYGIELGILVIKKISGEEVEIKKSLRKFLTTYLKAILPMLLIAALIETFITPIIASLF